jgi:hypothetical protein
MLPLDNFNLIQSNNGVYIRYELGSRFRNSSRRKLGCDWLTRTPSLHPFAVATAIAESGHFDYKNNSFLYILACKLAAPWAGFGIGRHSLPDIGCPLQRWCRFLHSGLFWLWPGVKFGDVRLVSKPTERAPGAPPMWLAFILANVNPANHASATWAGARERHLCDLLYSITPFKIHAVHFKSPTQ